MSAPRSAEERLENATCQPSRPFAASPASVRVPAEPSGHRPAAILDFARQEEAETVAGWEISDDKPGFHVVSDTTAPASPPFTARATYPPGFGDGFSPVWAGRDISARRYSRLYVCMWVKLSENWQGHKSGVNKIGFVWTRDSPVVYLAAVGRGSAPLEPQIRLQNLPSPLANARNLRPNLEPVSVERGMWHRWEVVLAANEPGAADGEAHWWINGVKAGEYRDILFMEPTDDRIWQRVSWRPIWGGRGDAVRETQYMWLDHFYVSGAR